MTLLVVLLLGLGGVLVVSAIETDPATGKSVSVLGTLRDIWNNNLDFAQPAMSQGNAGATGAAIPNPGNPLPGQGVGGATDLTLAHRASLVREWTRHRYGV